MYVAIKKNSTPHFFLPPRHMGWVILWLWGLITTEIRHIVYCSSTRGVAVGAGPTLPIKWKEVG